MGDQVVGIDKLDIGLCCQRDAPVGGMRRSEVFLRHDDRIRPARGESLQDRQGIVGGAVVDEDVLPSEVAPLGPDGRQHIGQIGGLIVDGYDEGDT